MSAEQYQKIQALKRCTFLPGSYQKRFVRDMSAKPEDFELSEKQAVYVDKLYYMYRRQISALFPSILDRLPPLVKPGALVQLELPLDEKRYTEVFGLLVEVSE